MDLLRKGFRDISRGYAVGRVLGQDTYIRHLSHADQIEQDSKWQEIFDRAHSQGCPTDKERLENLKSQRLWTDQKEREIQEHQEVMSGLERGRKEARWPSLAREYAKKAEVEEQVLSKLRRERAELFGITAEVYADQEVTDFYILTNMFSDEKMSKPRFDADEVDGMDRSEIAQIIRDYNAAVGPCTEQNIKKIAMAPFFQNYFALCGENMQDFFGCPICRMTFYQVSLLRVASQVRNVYMSQERIESWPEDVMKDADLFLDYAKSVDRAKKQVNDQGGGDGAIVIGGKNEDNKALGLNAQNNLARQVMEKSGGNLGEYFARRG